MTRGMLIKMRTVPLLLLLVWVYRTSGEVVSVKSCSCDRGNKNCTIDEVQITPCLEAKENAPCKLTTGEPVSYQFNFTTVPNLSDLEAFLFWGMQWISINTHVPRWDTNACKYTTCPTTGLQQTYKYDRIVNAKIPPGRYYIELILKKEGVMECCFNTELQLTSPFQ